ncbi:nucleoside monophosphate kinase [bacterium]|uniref:Adenylate kinase n=2 Tax=Katanobacteria TaxID=422282 RepID=A0A2M7X0K5_UNCKA|nr:nucleoside monophosphate kinase [bacterium]PIP56647.1 MAG: hypothetical protein COX05_02015 [candidate division WWE3 bacterium CG22_combo_CG10-13_8_21_14_all_39_12]PJA39355.1 MAG: hypothetical protein CO179_05330 [candidate division WWE3 bacterium CG_4_9_14_3_um_filter_39_7]
MKTILVMGPQGSGKSTQAKLLADDLGMQFLSVGESLRSYVNNNAGDIAKDLKSYMNKGELVPHEVVQMVVSLFLLEHPNENGYVVDGYPRETKQYNDFKRLFDELPVAIFVLDLDEDHIMDRISKRKELEHRKDETDDAVKRRLEIYRTRTKVVLDAAKKDNIPVEHIDGSASVKSIQDTLRSLYRTKYHV